jgi:hypothetical protein
MRINVLREIRSNFECQNLVTEEFLANTSDRLSQ